MRDRDRERSRRRRDAADSDDGGDANLAIPFAADEEDAAPLTGLSAVEVAPEFGRIVHTAAPVAQESGYAGKESKRDPKSTNKRKRGYGKRPVKAANAPGAPAGAAAGESAPFSVGGAGGGSSGGASAMAQRRKYILQLSEARSIGKRPAPQFTNYLYFRMQAARMQPMERLPRKQVVQAGRQAGRQALVGMMYPRLTTSSEAVARLALAPLKWRGLLENCVSSGQVCPPSAVPALLCGHMCLPARRLPCRQRAPHPWWPRLQMQAECR